MQRSAAPPKVVRSVLDLSSNLVQSLYLPSSCQELFQECWLKRLLTLLFFSPRSPRVPLSRANICSAKDLFRLDFWTTFWRGNGRYREPSKEAKCVYFATSGRLVFKSGWGRPNMKNERKGAQNPATIDQQDAKKRNTHTHKGA